MFSRQYGKSNLQKILQGMDFGKLEETAMLHVGKEIHERIMVSSPTARTDHQKDAIAAMHKSLQDNLFGVFASQIWGDEYSYVPPEPKLKTQVDQLIDDFWANPGVGHIYLYLEQLRKNPITKDLFKGESTTHHYPWYKRGSKY